MEFIVSVPNLINTIFIAAGIGICGLNFLQVSSSAHIAKELRQYFQVFFGLILVYITSHLARQLMDGLAGDGIRIALNAVTFVEVLAAGFMAWMLSMLVAAIAFEEDAEHGGRHARILLALLGMHTLLMLADLFGHFVFFFDSENVYHRGSLYLLSNLCPFAMLIINMIVLTRRRDRFSPRVRSAFWAYLIAPVAAIVIQSFTYGVQFIMIATVVAAAYMFLVIVQEQNEDYEKQKLESSRLETELSLAARIQADMLPNIFPAYPEREEFDIYASMTPAKEVGGDFYDFFFVDEDHLGIVMADVSGKGVPAALFMMISKMMVQNFAMAGHSPKDALAAANNQICANNHEDMFVTVWLGILELSTGRLVAANAGHEFPAIKSPNGSFELLKDKHGLFVGCMEGIRYTEYEVQLEPGSKLFLYTDGVPEAMNAEGKLFTLDRMVEALRSGEDGGPEDVLAAVNRGVTDFIQGEDQFDDLTMLCLHYLGKPQD